MKFSNQTNADAGSPNPEAGAAKVSGAVKTYHGNPEWDERERVSGKIYRAGRCEKTYRNQNGGFTAVFEKTPTQYQAADGSFQKIENELIRKDAEEDAVYCNKANSFAAVFQETLRSKVFTMEKGRYQIAFSLVDPSENELSSAKKRKLKGCFKPAFEKHAEWNPSNTTALKYPSYCKGTDLEYLVQDNGVKENIVLHEKRAQYKFAFLVNSTNLKMIAEETGGIRLVSTEGLDNEAVFRIPVPVMYDAAGEQSEAISYQFEQLNETDGQDGQYLFLIVADKEWINAEERAFPVTIDPQVIVEETENDSSILQVTRYLSDCYCNCSSFSGSGNYRVSYDGANTYSLGVRIFNPAANAKVFDRDIRVMRASLIWQISSGSSCGHFQVKSGNRILEHFVYDGQEELRLDITNQLNEMIRNNGTSFDMIVEPASDCNCNSYIYLKNAVGAMELLVDYIPNGMVENNSKSVTFDVKQAGAGSVNLATGKVLFEHSDVTADSAIMPVAVSHVFDGENANSEYGSIMYTNQSEQITPNYGMGKGWKLNVQQTLVVPDRNVPYRTNDLWGKTDKIYYVNGTGNQIPFEKKFFYLQDGVKHFIDQTECKKTGKDYIIDQNGHYKTDVDGKEYDVISAYMSDNGLYLSIDQSKAMYLDEREYEKYYEYRGVKHSITIKSGTSFEYQAFYFKWKDSNLTHEIDSRYVKENPEDHKYYVTLDLRQSDGTFETVEAFPKTFPKFLYKDASGEYFYIYSPEVCKSGTSYQTLVQERVDVFSVNLFTQDAVSLSNAHFSNELIQLDSILSELNQAIVDMEESYEAYIEQQIALQRNQRINDQIEAAQSQYYQIQGELMAANVSTYESQYNDETQRLQKQIDACNEELAKLNEWEAKNGFSQFFDPDRSIYHGKEESIREKLNDQINAAKRAQEMVSNQKDQAKLQERAFRIQERINDLQVSASKSNFDDQMKVLWDAREKVQTQKRSYVDLRNQKMEERNLIIRNEKKLPCDYIFDESGNVMAFDYYGRLIGIQNSNRNVISMTYQDNGLLSDITTTEETKIVFAYNNHNRLEHITDTSGRITRYEYAANDPARLIKIYSPEYDAEHPQYVTTFAYDASGRLTKVTDPSGYFVQLAYASNQITVSEHTGTAQISENGIENAEAVQDGESISIAFRSPFLTAVTAGQKTTVYQMDVVGRPLAAYEEESRIDSSRISVSKSAAFVYTGKRRSYSVECDPCLENLISGQPGFESSDGWTIYGSGSVTSAAYAEGSHSLCLQGSPDGDACVYKTLTSLPAGKRHFVLSLWAKAQSGQIDSERCTGYEDSYLIPHTNTELFDDAAHRKFGIQAYVIYKDGSTDRFYTSFDWYNTEWQLCQLPIRMKKEPASMQVSFEYGYNLNTAYIDRFRLTTEYGTECRYSDDGKLIWQSDGITEAYYTYSGGPYPTEVLEVDCEDAIANGCTQNCAACGAKDTCRHAVNKYGFNSSGQLLWSEDSNGIITKNTYDEHGRQLSGAIYHESDPTSKFWSESSYDEQGRELETADPRGEVGGSKLTQKMSYQQGTNLLQSVVSAGGKKTAYGYHHLSDACVSISSDNNGVESANHMTYFVGYLVRVDNTGGMWYNYVYDGFGKLKQVLINGEVIRSFGETKHTDGSRTTTETLAGGETSTAKTDAEGRLTETKRGETVVTNGYTYDEAGRCTGYTEYPNDTAKKKVHIYTYGELQNSHQVGNATGVYKNDLRGRMTEATYTISGGIASAYTYEYEDGLDGVLREVKWNDGNLQSLTQLVTHDKQGRQTGSSLIDDKTGATVCSRKTTYLKYGDHATGMVAELQYNVKGNAADRERYTYDADGNITAIHENGKLKVRYHYDGLNRLVREDNQPLKLTTTYTYDNGGNLLRQNEYAYSLSPTDELANGTEVVYTYGNENHPDQLTNYNGKAIVYNANGCPTNYLGNACTYEGGRLKTFGANTFDYDADGLRTKKNNVQFTYLDGRLIRQTGGTQVQIDYIYGASGELIGFKRAGTMYYYRRNQMGDVTHIYDVNGTLLAKYDYDAWGNHTVTKMGTNTIGDHNPIRYRGYYYDAETGLYYLQSRYYDPETGRFLSQDDTAYLAPESLTGLNLYAYCNNNPIMYVDSSGNIPKWLAWTLSGLAIVGGAILVATGIGGALGGVLLASGVGSIVGGYVNEANGGSFTAGWYGGLVSGALCAVGGALGGMITYMSLSANTISGTIALFGGGLFTSFIFGAGGSLAGNGIISYIDKTEFNWNDAIYDAVVTGVIGMFSASGAEFAKMFPTHKTWIALLNYVIEGVSDTFSYLMGKSRKKYGNPVNLF